MSTVPEMYLLYKFTSKFKISEKCNSGDDFKFELNLSSTNVISKSLGVLYLYLYVWQIYKFYS